ncbi:MAG: sel1 repeat family protein [Alphaproteobacteria bacterium]|nr:sel1 repeat family protein [Alphaproteobacteria bacterium]
MKSSFKYSILTTSCLVVSLSISYPAFSMFTDEEETKTTSLPRTAIGPFEKTDEEESFFTMTEFGNRKFDLKKWNMSLLQSLEEEHKVEKLFHLLNEAAFEGDEYALHKLYLFSTKEFMGINRVNEDKATRALRMGLIREQEWIVPIYENKIDSLQKEKKELIALKKSGAKIENLTEKQEELLRLHRDVVNTPLASRSSVERSEEFLEYLFPFHAQTWVVGSCAGTHREDIDTMLTRLKTYGYYKYFDGLYEGTNHIQGKNKNAKKFLDKKLQFLLEGVALDDVKALNNLYLFYKKNKQYEEALEVALILAQERGKVETIFNLGVEYSKGSIVKKDPQKAFEFFTKAADKGMQRAILELIKEYWYKDGEKKDFSKSFKYLNILEPEAVRIAGEQEKNIDDINPAEVFALLGGCYHYGHGVEKDDQKALDYFNQAALLGEQNALIYLAIAYQYGYGVEKNLEEAVKRWENASKRSPNEIVFMGSCYEARGHELQQKGNPGQAKQYFEKAYEYYEVAAKKQDARGMYNIATHHYLGLVRPKNLKRVREWLAKAVKEGYVEAMYAIGNVNLFNEPKNLKLAEEWLQKAAETGHLKAMLDLGWLYYAEYKKDIESFSLYKKAAELGSEEAQYNCGVLLLGKYVSEGDSSEDDEDRALSYFHKSADKGYSPAMTQLGKYYLERSDVESEKGKKT